MGHQVNEIKSINPSSLLCIKLYFMCINGLCYENEKYPQCYVLNATENLIFN